MQDWEKCVYPLLELLVLLVVGGALLRQDGLLGQRERLTPSQCKYD
jgi:hypothetical protein